MPISIQWPRREIVSEISVFIVISVRSVSVIIVIRLRSKKRPSISVSEIISGGVEVQGRTGRSVIEPVSGGAKM